MQLSTTHRRRFFHDKLRELNISRFVIFPLIALVSLVGAQESYLDSIDAASQFNPVEYWRRLYIIGMPHENEPQGLFAVQQARYADAHEMRMRAQENSSPGFKTAADDAIDRLFDLQQAANDLSVEFKSRAADLLPHAESFLESYGKTLPPEMAPTTENILQRLQLDFEQRLSLLQYPEIAKHQIFPGVRNQWSRYWAFLPLSLKNHFSSTFWEKAKSDEELDFEEYKKYAEVFLGNTISQQVLIAAYAKYRMYGRLPLSYVLPETEFETLRLLINKDTQSQVSALGLQTDTGQISKSEADFVYAIYRKAVLNGLKLDWELSRKILQQNSLQIQSSVWARSQFASDLGALDDLSNIDATESWMTQIDLLVDEHFSDEYGLYQLIVTSLEDEQRINLSLYRKLSDNVRSLLCARFFPSLTLSQAKALFSLDVLQLTSAEIRDMGKELFPSPADYLNFKMKWSAVDPVEPTERRQFSEWILQESLEGYFMPERPASLELLDGTLLPWISDKRRDLEQSFRDIDFKERRPWKEWWNLSFQPYPEFWKDEARRFVDEWKRLDLYQSLLHEKSELQERLEIATNTDERLLLTQKIDSLSYQLLQESNRLNFDPDSYATYVASFAHGLWPSHKNEWMGIGQAAGAGFILMTATKIVGGWRVLLFLGLDAGTRYVSTYYTSDQKRPFTELDFEKGFGFTPLGKWTLQALQESLQIADQFLFPMNLKDRLYALEGAGELTAGFVGFSAGAWIAKASLPYARVIRLRRMEWDAKKIEILKNEISERQKLIERLNAEHQSKVISLEKAKASLTADAILKAEKEIESLQVRIKNIETGAVEFRGRMEHLSLELASTIYNTFRFLNPLIYFDRSPKISVKRPSRGFFRRWNRHAQFGQAQLRLEIKAIEAGLQQQKASLFATSAIGKELKNVVLQLEKSQTRVALRLRDLDAALESSPTNIRDWRRLHRIFIKALNDFKAYHATYNRSSLGAFQRILESFEARPMGKVEAFLFRLHRPDRFPSSLFRRGKLLIYREPSQLSAEYICETYNRLRSQIQSFERVGKELERSGTLTPLEVHQLANDLRSLRATLNDLNEIYPIAVSRMTRD